LSEYTISYVLVVTPKKMTSVAGATNSFPPIVVVVGMKIFPFGLLSSAVPANASAPIDPVTEPLSSSNSVPNGIRRVRKEEQFLNAFASITESFLGRLIIVRLALLHPSKALAPIVASAAASDRIVPENKVIDAN